MNAIRVLEDMLRERDRSLRCVYNGQTHEVNIIQVALCEDPIKRATVTADLLLLFYHEHHLRELATEISKRLSGPFNR